MKLKLSLLMVAALAFIGVAYATSGAAAQPISRSPVIWFQAPGHELGEPVPHAFSTLLRRETSVSAELHTSQLTPGYTYTLWWVVFNNPDACEANTSGEPGVPPCGLPDVAAALGGHGNPAEIGILFAGGGVVGPTGRVNIGTILDVDSTIGCQTANLFAALCTPLTNPMGAQVDLVLHDHGPPVPGLVDEQTGSFEGGCNSYIIGSTGDVVEQYGLGDYDCFSPQASGHAP